jgi:hypothetical protein
MSAFLPPGPHGQKLERSSCAPTHENASDRMVLDPKLSPHGSPFSSPGTWSLIPLRGHCCLIPTGVLGSEQVGQRPGQSVSQR